MEDAADADDNADDDADVELDDEKSFNFTREWLRLETAFLVLSVKSGPILTNEEEDDDEPPKEEFSTLTIPDLTSLSHACDN